MNYHLAMMGMPFRCRQFFLFDEFNGEVLGLEGARKLPQPPS